MATAMATATATAMTANHLLWYLSDATYFDGFYGSGLFSYRRGDGYGYTDAHNSIKGAGIRHGIDGQSGYGNGYGNGYGFGYGNGYVSYQQLTS